MGAGGFSEPEAGSDLASLRCRARRDGDDYVVCGQKIWTSHGVGAACIGTLVRTGTSESRHRGLSMLMIDLDVPGVGGVRPIRFANGHNELAEVFFDDVRVPADRLVGAEGQGWDVAMFLLQYERGNYAWMRQAHIGRLVATLAASADASDQAMMSEVGAAWLAQQAVRIRCGRTVLRLGAGEALGPDISIDKVFARRRRATGLRRGAVHPATRVCVFRCRRRRSVARQLVLHPSIDDLRGGAAEIQRSIIADRVLKLPKEGR